MKGHDVIIVGGGISGAAILHRLASRGIDVVLIEGRDNLGGVIRSHRNRDGLLVETGANSTSITLELQTLIQELGLSDDLLTPPPSAGNRYIVRDDRLVAAPTSPRSFLRTHLFSRRAKLRILRERLVAPVSADIEESVAGFVERRLGREFLDYAIDPFVGGIFAGRPDRLSLRHAFPAMYRLEQDHRSLIRGAIRKGRETRKARRRGVPPPPKGLISFTDGMGMLPGRIAERWWERIVAGRPVERIEKVGEGWGVDVGGRRYHSTTLVLATDALAAAMLLDAIDPGAAIALRSIEYPPVAIAVSQYERRSVEHPLDGFGMLIPTVEGRNILGSLFSSSLFPHRAPDGTVLLTTFIGGARNPEQAGRPDNELEHLVHRDLQRLLGISARPIAFDLHRWERAIPQYALGYGRILDTITAAETAHRGLHLIGNYRGGISVGDCVRSAFQCADRLVSTMADKARWGIHGEYHMHDQET